MSKDLVIDETSAEAEQVNQLAVRSNTELSTEVRRNDLDDDLIDTGRIWRVILRYRRLIVLSTLLCGVIAFVYSKMLYPEYTAKGVLRFNPNTAIANVGAGDIQIAESYGGDWKALPTTLNLLAGRSVGKHAIESLNLQDSPEFTGEFKQRSFFPNRSAMAKIFSRDKASAPKSTTVSDYGIGVYRRRVQVKEIKGTDLIEVAYTSFDPKIAAMIANQVGSSYNQIEKDMQDARSQETIRILETELNSIQSKLLLSERKMTEFSRKTGVVDLDDQDDLLTARQSSVQASIIETQEKRIALENKILKVRNNNNAKIVERLVQNDEIIRLNSELNRVNTEYQELSAVFQPGYPKLKIIQTQRATLQRAIRTEVENAINQLVAEYEELFTRETQLLSQLDLGKNQILDLKDRSVAFNILKREWETNKNLYDGMLEKVKLASLASNLEISRISNSEAALVPVGHSFPNASKNVMTGLSIGALIGLALAFVSALRDRQFRSIQEVEDHAKAPILAVVPLLDLEQLHSGELLGDRDNHTVAKISWSQPSGQVAEIFRSLRTGMQYSMPGQEMKTMMITSSGPGEGKSTSTVNLASTFARNNMRTVIVDFDLRKPSLHKIFGVPRAPGVTDSIVTGTVQVRTTEIENLSIITSGSDSPNPTEMIDSARCMNLIKSLKKEYDVIFFDSPPVMGLADALVLAQHVNMVLMAVDISVTNKDSLKSTLNRLRRVNAPLAGILVTKYASSESDKYEYDDYHYYSYQYQYQYGESHEADRAALGHDKNNKLKNPFKKKKRA